MYEYIYSFRCDIPLRPYLDPVPMVLRWPAK